MQQDIRVIERDRRDQVGEGPLWVPTEAALYWVDILGLRLNRLSLADDSVHSWEVPEPLGWVIERANGAGFVAGLQSGFAFLQTDPLTITHFAAPEPDKPANRMNDAKADSDGAIWAGTMSTVGDAGAGALYRLDVSGQISCADPGYSTPNGPAISLDGRWLYHADSALGTVYRYTLEAGKLSGRETFVQFEDGWGLPDGMTVDENDGLWIAHWGAGCISRFTPDGKRERWIDLPAKQITSCTFAGANLDRMFVTSAALGKDGRLDGALFEVFPGFRGVPAFTYGR